MRILPFTHQCVKSLVEVWSLLGGVVMPHFSFWGSWAASVDRGVSELLVLGSFRYIVLESRAFSLINVAEKVDVDKWLSL